MKHLMDLINSNEIKRACVLIANSKELQDKATEINEIFVDANPNSSSITVYNDKVIGYEGNGDFTLDDPDYEQRHIRIDF